MFSDAERIASLDSAERERLLAGLSVADMLALLHDWAFWGRPEQHVPDGDWTKWLILAGRGWGKTRTGAEFVHREIMSGRARRFALVGATAADVRDVMVNGESGLMNIGDASSRPTQHARHLEWPNGAIATMYSAEEPSRLRGPQHDGFWADEIAAWRYDDAWDQLMLGLRLGAHPRGVATTTPRPTRLVHELLRDTTCHITRGTTYDNLRNLPQVFFDQIVRKYEGTRLGRQELNAEVLDDVQGSLWPLALRERSRVQEMPRDIERIVIGVDPAVTSSDSSDEVGILVACRTADNHAYVTYDFSGTFSPDQWARRVVKAYHKLEADRVVAEVNNGGDLVETVLRTVDPHISYRAVHAAKGKHVRAEPIAAMYEQGKIHHVGYFARLEEQMSYMTVEGYIGPDSPDRCDALVWALTDLMIDHAGATRSPERFASFTQ